ncbi:hypothetical protein BGW42_005817 [Actinomortierella wolfii]|nr:hypothetical protein BGW42_005817 [Actinomortierella wolfii]
MDLDEELARRLQEEEYQDLQREQEATTDDVYETNAPFKDLHGLFLAFNDLYFESKLSACEVKWSPRMTLCAGLCVYQPKARFCSIRLSEPLLKFRPESDYIDTLLHEMIHAYLFVTKAIQDHNGHGKDFLSHAKRINDAAGTNITVYHTFHDEVSYYQTHVWQCDGPCRHQPPYFGIVRRSMNRPPQPADRWWAEHQLTCGGKYTKISEPEPTNNKKQKKKSSGSSESSAASTPPQPLPRPRTMLDDFVIKKEPSSKQDDHDGTKKQGWARASSSTSAEQQQQQQQQGGYRLDGRDQTVESTNATNGTSPPLSSPSVTSKKSVATQNTPSMMSPHEAAALAAIARQERFRKEQNSGGDHIDLVAAKEKKHLATPSTPIAKSSKSVLSNAITTSRDNGVGDSSKAKRSRNTSPSPPLQPVIINLDAEEQRQGEETPSSLKKIKCENDGSDYPLTDVMDHVFNTPRSRSNANRSPPPPQPAKFAHAKTTTTTSTELHDTAAENVSLVGHENNNEATMVTCPVCASRVLEVEINDHIDLCIWRASGGE